MAQGLRLTAYGLVLTTALAVPVYAQESTPPPATTAPKPAEGPAAQKPATTTPQIPATPLTPEELERIKQGLARPEFKVDDSKIRFYVEVVGKYPTWVDIAKGYDLVNGPTKGGNPMTHGEYLSMVTPRDMIGSAGIKPMEIVQFALVNFAGQALIKKAIQEFGKAHNERELREIRDRIDKELAALSGATPVIKK